MCVNFSGQWSGSFISTGVAQMIALPAGCDTLMVRNETVLAAGGAGSGAEFYWRKGMAQGRGLVYTKEATIGALVPTQIAANLGFFWQDTTVATPGAATATTGITNANPPLVTTAGGGVLASGLVNGNIVRLYNPIGALQLGGIDFTVGNVAAAQFELANMPAIIAGPAAGAYRIIPFNPYFYPSTRYITKMRTSPLDATRTQVTLSVTHSYIVGQKVTFNVPRVTALAFGMTEMNGLTATIVAIGEADVDALTNTITVDVDSSGFTAYALPLTNAPGFTWASVRPAGEDTRTALNAGLNIYSDAMLNTGVVGMMLMPGVTGPAGVNTNVISWVAGKSWNI